MGLFRAMAAPSSTITPSSGGDSVEDCKDGVGICHVLDVGLSDSVCPAGLERRFLIVALEGFPDFKSEGFECLDEGW